MWKCIEHKALQYFRSFEEKLSKSFKMVLGDQTEHDLTCNALIMEIVVIVIKI